MGKKKEAKEEEERVSHEIGSPASNRLVRCIEEEIVTYISNLVPITAPSLFLAPSSLTSCQECYFFIAFLFK